MGAENFILTGISNKFMFIGFHATSLHGTTTAHSVILCRNKLLISRSIEGEQVEEKIRDSYLEQIYKKKDLNDYPCFLVGMMNSGVVVRRKTFSVTLPMTIFSNHLRL